MVNKQNLKVPTSEEARKNGSKGGKKSAEVRARKKLMQEVANDLLQGKPIEKLAAKTALAFNIKAEEIDNQTLILLAQLKKAIEGDQKAFELIRDTAGQAPVQKNELTGANGSPLMPIKIMVDFGEDKPKLERRKKNVNADD